MREGGRERGGRKERERTKKREREIERGRETDKQTDRRTDRQTDEDNGEFRVQLHEIPSPFGLQSLCAVGLGTHRKSPRRPDLQVLRH